MSRLLPSKSFATSVNRAGIIRPDYLSQALTMRERGREEERETHRERERDKDTD